ncbi:putative glutamate--tRNA ligase [Plasmodium gaboni]|uniref:glutamate--tRNA ligase n=1 Tax=Plasmodium gaboni TaxID=647221 RepID=A0A151LE80_9APIC|nr:putative glutamate--tRNA ligase [Plasmodium gaboni]KYN97263.1 putative glutamate--tRNA ligase [Plasmodium gaboni]
MLENTKVNIFYGNNKYPFICKSILNVYKNKNKKSFLKSGSTVNVDENIKFIKDAKVEELKIEFITKDPNNNSNNNINHCDNKKEEGINLNKSNNIEKLPYICSSDKIFAKILDHILQTNLHNISEKVDNKNNKVFNIYIQTQYDEWIDFFRCKNMNKDIEFICEHLNKHLHLNTFVVSEFLTLSDIFIYFEMYKYFHVTSSYYAKYSKIYKNINRWHKLIDSLIYVEDAEWKKNLKVLVCDNKTNLDVRKDSVKNNNHNNNNNKNNKNNNNNNNKSTNIVDDGKSKKKNVATSYSGKLENAVVGNVVTRFPPEPSGYLHIGHAKAAFLNNYYAQMYEGKMLLRFDDTNPVLEDIKYEKSIIEDLEMLGLKYEKISYSSDHFDLLENYCIEMIKMNKAYADDTSVEEMRNQRGEGIESVNRNNSIEKNLELFNEMRKGTEIGQKNCIRAKINMQSKNKCMRDPVMYRCIVDVPHHKHQFKYKCYPTYDFACPIIDSFEGVTHALRTNEYSDRIEQYNWFISTLSLRKVYIYEFSRLAFVKTVMSKRKLKWFVENNVVDSWLDPRFPTIKGILRRGLTKEALFQFILEQGPSKAGNLMQWDKLWSINKQIIDPIIPRYAAVNKNTSILLILTDLNDTIIEKQRDLHMKNKSLGTCTMYYNNKYLIEFEDAQSLVENEEITLIKLGNIIIKNIEKHDGKIKQINALSNFDGDFKTTKKKIHWLPYLPQQLITCTLYEYDHLITVDKFENDNKEDWTNFINFNSKYETLAYAEPSISTLKVSDKFQFERRGYFIVDKIDSNQHLHLIKIPDGKSKNMSIITTKVDPKQLAGTKHTKNN